MEPSNAQNSRWGENAAALQTSALDLRHLSPVSDDFQGRVVTVVRQRRPFTTYPGEIPDLNQLKLKSLAVLVSGDRKVDPELCAANDGGMAFRSHKGAGRSKTRPMSSGALVVPRIGQRAAERLEPGALPPLPSGEGEETQKQRVLMPPLSECPCPEPEQRGGRVRAGSAGYTDSIASDLPLPWCDNYRPAKYIQSLFGELAGGRQRRGQRVLKKKYEQCYSAHEAAALDAAVSPRRVKLSNTHADSTIVLSSVVQTKGKVKSRADQCAADEYGEAVLQPDEDIVPGTPADSVQSPQKPAPYVKGACGDKPVHGLSRGYSFLDRIDPQVHDAAVLLGQQQQMELQQQQRLPSPPSCPIDAPCDVRSAPREAPVHSSVDVDVDVAVEGGSEHVKTVVAAVTAVLAVAAGSDVERVASAHALPGEVEVEVEVGGQVGVSEEGRGGGEATPATPALSPLLGFMASEGVVMWNISDAVVDADTVQADPGACPQENQPQVEEDNGDTLTTPRRTPAPETPGASETPETPGASESSTPKASAEAEAMPVEVTAAVVKEAVKEAVEEAVEEAVPPTAKVESQVQSTGAQLPETQPPPPPPPLDTGAAALPKDVEELDAFSLSPSCGFEAPFGCDFADETPVVSPEHLAESPSPRQDSTNATGTTTAAQLLSEALSPRPLPQLPLPTETEPEPEQEHSASIPSSPSTHSSSPQISPCSDRPDTPDGCPPSLEGVAAELPAPPEPPHGGDTALPTLVPTLALKEVDTDPLDTVFGLSPGRLDESRLTPEMSPRMRNSPRAEPAEVPAQKDGRTVVIHDVEEPHPLQQHMSFVFGETAFCRENSETTDPGTAPIKEGSLRGGSLRKSSKRRQQSVVALPRRRFKSFTVEATNEPRSRRASHAADVPIQSAHSMHVRRKSVRKEPTKRKATIDAEKFKEHLSVLIPGTTPGEQRTQALRVARMPAHERAFEVARLKDVRIQHAKALLSPCVSHPQPRAPSVQDALLDGIPQRSPGKTVIIVGVSACVDPRIPKRESIPADCHSLVEVFSALGFRVICLVSDPCTRRKASFYQQPAKRPPLPPVSSVPLEAKSSMRQQRKPKVSIADHVDEDEVHLPEAEVVQGDGESLASDEGAEGAGGRSQAPKKASLFNINVAALQPPEVYVATKENIQREINSAYASSTSLIIYYLGYKHGGTLGAAGGGKVDPKDFYVLTSASVLAADMTLTGASQDGFMKKSELYPTDAPNLAVINTPAGGGASNAQAPAAGGGNGGGNGNAMERSVAEPTPVELAMMTSEEREMHRAGQATTIQLSQASQGFCTCVLVLDTVAVTSGALDSDPNDTGSAVIECRNTVGGYLSASYTRSQSYLMTHYLLKGVKGSAMRDRTLGLNGLNVFLEKKMKAKGVVVETAASGLNVGGFVIADKLSFYGEAVLCPDRKVMKTRRGNARDVPLWVVLDLAVPVSGLKEGRGDTMSEEALHAFSRRLHALLKPNASHPRAKRAYDKIETHHEKYVRSVADTLLGTEAVGLSVRGVSYCNTVLLTLAGSGWTHLIANPVKRNELISSFEEDLKGNLFASRVPIGVESYLHQGSAVLEVSFGQLSRRRESLTKTFLASIHDSLTRCITALDEERAAENQKNTPFKIANHDITNTPVDLQHTAKTADPLEELDKPLMSLRKADLGGVSVGGVLVVDIAERVHINVLTSDYAALKMDRAVRSGELGVFCKRVFAHQITPVHDFTSKRDTAARQIQAFYRSALEGAFLRLLFVNEKAQAEGRAAVMNAQREGAAAISTLLLEEGRAFVVSEEAAIRADKVNWEIEERGLLFAGCSRSFLSLESYHRKLIGEEQAASHLMHIAGEGRSRWLCEGAQLFERTKLRDISKLGIAQNVQRDKIRREQKSSEIGLLKFRSKRF